MTLSQILKQLQSLGNPSMRKLNVRSGAGENQFGVKLADIRSLAKSIGINERLARELWKTGNLDARLLAILLFEPNSLSRAELNRLVRSITVVQEAEWLIAYVVKKHPEKEALRVAWMAESDRWVTRSGWSLTAERVAKNPEGLDLPALLDRIEAEMGDADPIIQWTMNATLAEIGIHHAKLRKRAMSIGESLGVFRDYPVSKGCTSPFAPIWIQHLVNRQG